MPGSTEFGPIGNRHLNDGIVMAIDEYETIRLIDLLGYTQEQCAAQMNVARTTVQGIYNDARRKLADALVNGKSLVIRGGDYEICGETAADCNCGGCRRRGGQHEYGK